MWGSCRLLGFSRYVIVHIPACHGSLRITASTVKLIDVLCPNDPQVPIETFPERHPRGRISGPARRDRAGSGATMCGMTSWQDVEEAVPEFARRVRTHLDEKATLLVVEWWTPADGLQRVERA
jgi:hypothetical protein